MIDKTDRTIILSLGMGVESVAILMRWIHEPETCPAPLEDLIVITSMVGDEYLDTGRDMREHVLPLLCQHNIRFVQLARRGHLEEDGITVLSDTRQPTELFLAGDYKLSDELRRNGTVPQFGGEHRCALKFKAFVIDTWLDQHVRTPALHAFGYNVDEQSRILKSQDAFTKAAAKKAKAKGRKPKTPPIWPASGCIDIAFGFNSDEQSRIERSKDYDSPCRTGLYPLDDWGWTRQDCLDYIAKHTGVQWKKSACVYCPFAHNAQSLPDLIARHKEHPSQVADGITLERMSLSMNHRGTLYRDSTLIQLTAASGNMIALGLAEERLEDAQWAVYRVRRIYSMKGKADRAVEVIERHADRDGAEDALLGAAQAAGRATEFVHGDIMRVPLRQRVEDVYPTTEEFLVAAPAWAEDKTAHGIGWFDRKWEGAVA